MRVLHVDTGRNWRGGQRQVLYLHNGLLQNGVDSFLIAYSKGQLIIKCQRNVLPLPSSNEFSLISVMHLKKHINAYRPHIVHTHDAHSLTHAILASYFSNPFVLINTRRVDFRVLKNIFSHWKYKHPRLNKIITVSNAISDVLIDEGIPTKKIEVIYSGVEPIKCEHYQYSSEFNWLKQKAKLIFGCVASFADHKDHFTLLKAFDILYQCEPNVYLILAGEGSLKHKIELFVRGLNCCNNVIFAGFREDIYNVYKCLDVFVITSKEEGLCTSILDAMQFGLPIVATRAGGIPEIVHDNVNGLLCDIQNHKDIAAKMLMLIRDINLRNRLAIGSLELIKNFYIDKMIQKHIKLYQQLILELGSQN